VQAVMDVSGKELTAQDLWHMFEREYGITSVAAFRYQVMEAPGAAASHGAELLADFELCGHPLKLRGQGTGPIDAFIQGVNQATGHSVRVLDYRQHSVGAGADARSVAYIELCIAEGQTLFGVGMDTNVVTASLKAIVSGLQRAGVLALPQDRETAVPPVAVSSSNAFA
ncbi:MAG: alpha-isopropylmalate synthase regulatory domain-containing protein, partial [Rhodoferax sp.]